MRALLVILACALPLTGSTPARADDGPRLRGWFLELQWSAGERDRWDVFGRDALPPAAVERLGRGGGLALGRRFGGRFLLGLQLTLAEHDLQGLAEKLYDGEALLTGTVLFHERGVLQPFLRGGFGGATTILERPGPGDPRTVALGTAAVAGAGLQARLGSRVSLEAEAVANFSNFLEVQDDPGGGAPEDDWKVKTSQAGWRAGLGLMLWF